LQEAWRVWDNDAMKTVTGIWKNGQIVLDGPADWPQGCRVSVEPANGDDRQRRFLELAKEWKEATLLMSSVTDMATHPAYQQIIGMGKEALPLLLDELRREPDHWFWALQAITGENPVPAAERGNLERMTETWLAWAKQHDARRAAARRRPVDQQAR
jgi:hypothetical protein